MLLNSSENYLTKFDNSGILKLAIEEASKSSYKHRVAAVIFKGKRIVSIAHNAIRSNDVPYKFCDYLESLHAEAHAIIKARRNLKGYNILVIRVNNFGKLLNAKPCEFCYQFIQYVKIKTIFHSTNDNTIERIKL